MNQLFFEFKKWKNSEGAIFPSPHNAFNQGFDLALSLMWRFSDFEDFESIKKIDAQIKAWSTTERDPQSLKGTEG